MCVPQATRRRTKFGAPCAVGLARRDIRTHISNGVIGAGGTLVSPIGRGLAAIFNSVCDSAIREFGDMAWYTTDGPEEEDPEMHLAEPWYTASLCLIEAAMALGAPDLLPDAGRKTLTAPWHALTRSSLS